MQKEACKRLKGKRGHAGRFLARWVEHRDLGQKCLGSGNKEGRSASAEDWGSGWTYPAEERQKYCVLQPLGNVSTGDEKSFY